MNQTQQHDAGATVPAPTGPIRLKLRGRILVVEAGSGQEAVGRVGVGVCGRQGGRDGGRPEERRRSRRAQTPLEAWELGLGSELEAWLGFGSGLG